VTRTLDESLVGLLALLGTIGAVVVLARAGRMYRRSRHARLMAGPLAVLLEFVAGDPADDGSSLVAMPIGSWRMIEPRAIELLGKVRGDARQALVEVFERRGAVDRAMRDVHGRGLVRRAHAAEILGRLGHRDAVEVISALLADRSPELQTVSVRALGRLGSPAAAPALLDVAGAGSVAAHLVVQALARLDPAADEAIMAALDDSRSGVRLLALGALGQRGVTSGEERVIELLAADVLPAVRCQAAAVLSRIGTAAAVPVLIAATDSAEPTPLRVQATVTLGELAACEAAGRLLELLSDPGYPVAHSAAQALAHLGAVGRRALEHAGVEPTDRGAPHAIETLAMLALTEQRAGRRAGRRGVALDPSPGLPVSG
jgi:hypothetical protein